MTPEPQLSGQVKGRWVWLEQWSRDLRFSLRSLRRSAGFSIAVIVTLALCIGANTTIMSVLYGLILKPLPFRDASQLVEIYNSYHKTGRSKMATSVAQYLDYKAHADPSSRALCYGGFGLSILAKNRIRSGALARE